MKKYTSGDNALTPADTHHVHVYVLAAADVPRNFNVYVALEAHEQVRIVWNNPLIADDPITIAPLKPHPPPILRESVVSDARGVKSILGEFLRTQTVSAIFHAPQMRSHIARRMQHVLLHCCMMVRMGCWIGEFSAHNVINRVNGKHPISQYEQHMNVRQSPGLKKIRQLIMNCKCCGLPATPPATHTPAQAQTTLTL
jgi:hypothetical protein